MAINELASEIISSINLLPSDKVAEVRDFVNFLKERYAITPATEHSTVRNDEDKQDLTAAVLRHANTSGRFLEWLEERMNPAEMDMALSRYLPDFQRSALSDPQQRVFLNQRLAALGPMTLYELHQQNAGQRARLRPTEIAEKTWGTIKGIDQELLREIIEDEDYCGY